MNELSGTAAAANLIGGRWDLLSGATLVSHNPARPSQTIWSGSPTVAAVDHAVRAASAALPLWRQRPIEQRAAVLRRFAALATKHQSSVAESLCDEVGKVLWESKQEAALLSAKVDITLDPSPQGGLHRVTPFALSISPTRDGRCLFRPHGVMAVLGPFNFPVHLPNGHIVPALLMGNTVVFKPSDKAPAAGQILARLFDTALREELGDDGAAGVFNLVHGGADVASSLVSHEGLDGICFTGSWGVGRKILAANLDRPGRIVALELGGNNAAIVMDDADLRQAAVEIVRCAFNTTGQRCTSTRRAIIHAAVAPRLIRAICKAATNLIIGPPRAAHPVFMGPMISAAARESVLAFQRGARQSPGCEVLVEAAAIEQDGGYYVSPGVMVVDGFTRSDADVDVGGGGAGADCEVFGPLLRISVVDSFDEALRQANATEFGLAASLFSKNAALIERFFMEARAGCLNINTGTAGASGKLPFGGLGLSGNHRPAGAFALDYCAHPVAAMVETADAQTVAVGMRFEDSWVA